jgi:hypothetical protein
MVAAYAQPGSSHGNGRSPRCVRLCLARWLDRVALYAQPGSSHGNGRSPLCVRLWLAVVAAYSQPGSSHAYGRSPLCAGPCRTRASGGEGGERVLGVRTSVEGGALAGADAAMGSTANERTSP